MIIPVGILNVLFFTAFMAVFASGEQLSSPNFNKEDFMENLIESPSLNESEEFKILGYLNDDFLVGMKVDLTNYKRSVMTQVAEIIVEYLPNNPPEDKLKNVQKMSEIVHRCSSLEDNIWLIMKIRCLHEQKTREDILAEKPKSLH